jgi:hypothetical protein
MVSFLPRGTSFFTKTVGFALSLFLSSLQAIKEIPRMKIEKYNFINYDFNGLRSIHWQCNELV